MFLVIEDEQLTIFDRLVLNDICLDYDVFLLLHLALEYLEENLFYFKNMFKRLFNLLFGNIITWKFHSFLFVSIIKNKQVKTNLNFIIVKK